jgi:hypothetical protein
MDDQFEPLWKAKGHEAHKEKNLPLPLPDLWGSSTPGHGQGQGLTGGIVARRWIVSYVADAGWPVYRYFPTRSRAKTFYRKLCSRPRPPVEQSIGQETFPVKFEDLRLAWINLDTSGHWSVKVRVGRRPMVLNLEAALDYGGLRKALKEQAGFELPDRRPGLRAWLAFLSSRGAKS